MFSRTPLLLGADALEKLKKSHVAVFGVGGVGGYAVEALARTGVGEITLIDNDKVSVSNLNRQIIALYSTVGQYKTQVAKNRLLDINPQIKVHTKELFVLPETVDEIDFSAFDCVVDAIDTVSGKLAIIQKAKSLTIPVISAMGAGNKLDPTAFTVTDISKTSGCPLARVMRKELKKRGIEGVKVVYSKEEPKTPQVGESTAEKTVGSVAFVPSVAGLIVASETVKELIGR